MHFICCCNYAKFPNVGKILILTMDNNLIDSIHFLSNLIVLVKCELTHSSERHWVIKKMKYLFKVFAPFVHGYIYVSIIY